MALRRGRPVAGGGRPYVGPDRRSTLSAGRNLGAGTIAKGAAVPTLIVAVGVAVTVARGATDAATASLADSLGGRLAVLAGTVVLITWRLNGSAFTGLFGAALVSLGGLTLLERGLPVLTSWPRTTVMGGATIVVLVVAALLIRGLRSAEVDSRMAPVRVAGLVTALGAGALVAADSAQGALVGNVSDGPTVAASQLATGIGWLTLAICLAVAGRRHHHLPTWPAPVLAVLGVAALLRAAGPADGWEAVAGSSAAAAALAVALGAAFAELQSSVGDNKYRALRLRGDLARLSDQLVEERSALEDRLHDMRNAVGALRAADSTLRRYATRLDDATRNTLADALTAELRRLQVLIQPSRPAQEVVFLLMDVVGPVIEAERAQGLSVDADIAEVWALGDPEAVAQVVQNLLVNVRIHAPGSAAHLTGRQRAGRAELVVADDGPGIAPEERRSVFARGVRGSGTQSRPGQGIGLFAGSTLMAGMGGSLRLLDGDGRGTCFVLEIPTPLATSAPAVTAQPGMAGTPDPPARDGPTRDTAAVPLR
ncbi:HAMP domain-containing histidine kinase [Acidiferrimicrobium sp. IK]|uniref:sensor histidine kinase n=1 Tax=Acidiferrimicrobium sp. IK TaxID=2871700 RepID=UPI0021CB38C6|nr:HAMP domain-containing sensor histidine kinase [Acidiferrimicrobium sp. IK]MCU4182940.1 HAMP domain-containing histidine kinase [Acidiferrimicrobium sp. IK]